MNAQIPRGIRNNNPGNIRHGDKWRGLAEDQLDKEFCTFSAPEWGIRAMVTILRNYAKRGIRTPRQIITTWAPPTENNTAAYIASVCNSCGVHADVAMSLGDSGLLMALLVAIIKHENAGMQPYSDATLLKAIELA